MSVTNAGVELISRASTLHTRPEYTGNAWTSLGG